MPTSSFVIGLLLDKSSCFAGWLNSACLAIPPRSQPEIHVAVSNPDLWEEMEPSLLLVFSSLSIFLYYFHVVLDSVSSDQAHGWRVSTSVLFVFVGLDLVVAARDSSFFYENSDPHRLLSTQGRLKPFLSSLYRKFEDFGLFRSAVVPLWLGFVVSPILFSRGCLVSRILLPIPFGKLPIWWNCRRSCWTILRVFLTYFSFTLIVD